MTNGVLILVPGLATLVLLACGIAWGRRQAAGGMAGDIARLGAVDQRSQRLIASIADHQDDENAPEPQLDWGAIASTVLLGSCLTTVLIPVGLSLSTVLDSRLSEIPLVFCVGLSVGTCGLAARLLRLCSMEVPVNIEAYQDSSAE